MSSFSLDAFWSNTNSQWQLCPQPFPQGVSTSGQIYALDDGIKCQDNVTLDSVYSVIATYIQQTETSAIATNLLTLRLNLNQLNQSIDVENNVRGDYVLSTNISSIFGPRVYTPLDLENDRKNGVVSNIDEGNNFPPLHYFLLSINKRILVLADDSQLIQSISTGMSSTSSSSSTATSISTTGSGKHTGTSSSTTTTTTTTSTPTPSFSQNINGDYQVLFVNSNITFQEEQSLTLTNDLVNTCANNGDQPSQQDLINHINETSMIPFRAVFDTPDFPFTDVTLGIISQCGYTPMLNSSSSLTDPMSNSAQLTPQILVDVVNNSFWSWAPGEPNTNKTNASKPKSITDPVALQCAVITPEGWKVANCYEPFPVMCRGNDSNFDWIATGNKSTYFDAPQSCPKGTNFSVPRTSLENLAARSVLQQEVPAPKPSSDSSDDSNSSPGGSINVPAAWIDFNTIAVDECWVTGGPFSACPYLQIPTTNRNGVALLSIAAVVAFVLLMAMILLNFRRIPLRRNQARWRRLINKFAEQEYEGVPL
ncbi:Mtc6p [Sugiyamaella lignohabitans]|uniref:Maintenance of telomere capping protein 6 n=1 Tax=Sugiyamaella lignohabitans TaxID=796027 RepID=A0A167F1V2_9ASCO|nr:Mtc6p [Sugiyamaella lignohabitans]ANB14718.1 Mtc6p [Sugiyamaella lignohabitans]